MTLNDYLGYVAFGMGMGSCIYTVWMWRRVREKGLVDKGFRDLLNKAYDDNIALRAENRRLRALCEEHGIKVVP